jgi:rubredoxin
MRHSFSAPAGSAGRKARCSKCAHVFIIEEPDAIFGAIAAETEFLSLDCICGKAMRVRANTPKAGQNARPAGRPDRPRRRNGDGSAARAPGPCLIRPERPLAVDFRSRRRGGGCWWLSASCY